MDTGIIIQARTGSTRLPGKIFKKIGPKTLLEHVIFRLGQLKHPADIVIATTDKPADDSVLEFCEKNLLNCFRGSEDNVLERYYLCAQLYGFKNIVRITSDNPFYDIEELDNLIDLFFREKADFAHSFDSLPVGVGAEIFSFRALEKSFKEGKETHHKEHVDEYMLENPQIFKTRILETANSKRRPDIRLTVDTEDDYRRACFIVENSSGDYVNTEKAIELCSRYA